MDKVSASSRLDADCVMEPFLPSTWPLLLSAESSLSHGRCPQFLKRLPCVLMLSSFKRNVQALPAQHVQLAHKWSTNRCTCTDASWACFHPLGVRQDIGRPFVLCFHSQKRLVVEKRIQSTVCRNQDQRATAVAHVTRVTTSTRHLVTIRRREDILLPTLCPSHH